MAGGRIRQVVGPTYDVLFEAALPQRRKSRLRSELMRLPVVPGYPFDVEAKLLRSVGVGPVMLDIGAGTGVYGALLEDVVGGPENLYVFEPLSYLCDLLLRRFRRAHVFDFALSSSTGTQYLRVPHLAGMRCHDRVTLSLHDEPDWTGVDEVPVRHFALDDVVSDLPLESIGLVRIDVEGHELAVLEGATRTLERFRPLLLVGIEARHHTVPMAEVFARVERLGYEGYFLRPETFALHRTSDFDVVLDQRRSDLVARRSTRYLDNFFFVPQSRERDFVAKALGFLGAEERLVTELRHAGELQG